MLGSVMRFAGLRMPSINIKRWGRSSEKRSLFNIATSVEGSLFNIAKGRKF